MATTGLFFAFFLFLSFLGALALYYFVRREAENTERMRRDEAHERVSRDQDDT